MLHERVMRPWMLNDRRPKFLARPLLTYAVDDLEAKHTALDKLGYAPLAIKEFKCSDVLLARFFFVQDPDGYKIEVLQKYGHHV